MLTLDELKKLCVDSGVYSMCAPVLEDSRLLIWPLDCTTDSRHSCIGGLSQHLFEVVSSGILLTNLYLVYFKIDINIRELLIGAIWRYYGKFLIMTPKDESNSVWNMDGASSFEAASVSGFAEHFYTLKQNPGYSPEQSLGVSYRKILELIGNFDTPSSESVILKSAITLSKTIHT